VRENRKIKYDQADGDDADGDDSADGGDRDAHVPE